LLCLNVAAACGHEGEAVVSVAAAIELLHCASLVHDDLPCFDDADLRRGKPSVHREFGEPIAILTGDALIVLAFETLASAGSENPRALPQLLGILSGAVGMGGGLTAGQAWESEPRIPLSTYHRAKTGSLFVAAAKAGAVCAGGDPAAWEKFGAQLGEAYQVADDIRDVASSATELGKPVAKDSELMRPNAVGRLGGQAAVERLEQLIDSALAAVPDCQGAAELKQQVRTQSRWFVPSRVAQFAA
jgi:geranylgeranyl diphosphate synthase type II